MRYYETFLSMNFTDTTLKATGSVAVIVSVTVFYPSSRNTPNPRQGLPTLLDKKKDFICCLPTTPPPPIKNKHLYFRPQKCQGGFMWSLFCVGGLFNATVHTPCNVK